jgi:CTP:molybdopterin cytidylyltransferase MocA
MNKGWGVVVLAAGDSSRMGRMKASLLMPDASPFLHYILKQYRSAGCQSCRLVLNQEVESWWQDRWAGHWPEVKVSLNREPHKGMLHSVKMGLQELAGAEAIFVQKVDSPLVDPAMLKKMLSALEQESWLKPRYQNKGGHPVLLPGRVISAFLEEKNNEKSFREALQAFPAKVLAVEDASILWNIDTPEQYRTFIQSVKQ